MAASRRYRELGEALVMVGDKANEARRLINRGADVNYVSRDVYGGVETSTTPLIQAACLGHASVISVLIEKGANVNLHEPCNGDTALHMAAERGRREVAARLLDGGAIIDAQDKDGYTPVLSAAQEGHLPLVDLLVACGADLHLSNFEGTTPLIMAAQQGHLDVVKFLVEKGSEVDQLANNGCTTLCQALFHGHLEVVDFLISAGAEINYINAKGECPLHAAAQGGHLNAVKLLVKKGVNIHVVDDQGLSPLILAAFYGHQDVVDYLMKKGAAFEATGTIAKACKCCGASDAKLKCSLCLTVWYCCKECQSKDWKEGGEDKHKIQCKKLIEIRDRYVEKAKKEIEEKIAEFDVGEVMVTLRDLFGGGAGPINPRVLPG